jgi:hypothetical protein
MFGIFMSHEYIAALKGFEAGLEFTAIPRSQSPQNRWDNVAKKPFDFKGKKVSHFLLTH